MLAIDGKTLRRSFDTAAGRSLLHVVTAFATDRRLTLGRAAMHGKENEIAAARSKLEMFRRRRPRHWQIENGLHSVLDTCFDEDRARQRSDHGPENLAIPCKLALNVLRPARPDISIRRKRKQPRLTDEFARSVLGQMR